jgi:hypothetical protein
MGKKKAPPVTEPLAVYTTADEIIDEAKRGQIVVGVLTYEIWDPSDLKHCPADTLFSAAVLGHWVRIGDQSKKRTVTVLDSFVAGERELPSDTVPPDFGAT